MADTPPLPPGFTLDSAPATGSMPPLPPGFTLDQAAPASPPAAAPPPSNAVTGQNGGSLSAFIDSLGKQVAVPGKPDWNLDNAGKHFEAALPSWMGGKSIPQQEADEAATAGSNPISSAVGTGAGVATDLYTGSGEAKLAGGAIGALTAKLAGRTGGAVPAVAKAILTNPTFSKLADTGTGLEGWKAKMFGSTVGDAAKKALTRAAMGAQAIPSNPGVGAAVGAGGPVAALAPEYIRKASDTVLAPWYFSKELIDKAADDQENSGSN